MPTSANNVWVFIEQRDGKAADVSFELLSKGRKLADTMGGSLIAVVIGDAVRAIALETFRYGANEAFIVEHPSLKQFRTLPYSRILNGLVEQHVPRVVLLGRPSWAAILHRVSPRTRGVDSRLIALI